MLSIRATAGPARTTLAVLATLLSSSAMAAVIVGADGAGPVTGTEAADLIYADPAAGSGNPTSMTGVTLRKQTDGTIQQANGDSSMGRPGAVSRDGRYLLVRMNAVNIVGGSGNSSPFQLVRRDLVGETWTVVSAAATGNKNGDGDSGTGVFSPDGSKVYFETKAKNLTGDPQGRSQVVVKNLADGSVTVLSRTLGGAICSGDSTDPVLSPDGKRLAFVSDCPNLPGADGAGGTNPKNVYVMDVSGPAADAQKTIARVSITAAGDSSAPVFSPDGGSLAFLSSSDDLVEGDIGGTDVFLKALGPVSGGKVDGDAVILSTDSNGDQVAGTCSGHPVFSPDGSRIAFTCDKAFDSADTDGKPDIYLKVLATAPVVVAACGGSMELSGGETLPLGVASSDETTDPAFSPDGEWLAFASPSPELAGGVNSLVPMEQVYRVGAGGLGCPANIVSRSPLAGAQPAELSATNPIFTADGSAILFESKASNLATDFGTSVVAIFRAGLPTPAGGADQVFALGGDDIVFGGPGNDAIDGGAGIDAMNGGPGDDTYVVDNEGDTVVETAQGGIDTVQSSVTFTLAGNIETLVLTGTAPVNGAGGPEANTILGNVANNLLFGNDGDDSLSGGPGDDGLDGGVGNDLLDGGAGKDILVGGLGDDTLAGGGANDALDGGDGNDGLAGGGGRDTLVGGAGDDRLTGGAGRDRLTGGAGADVFAYLGAGDSRPGKRRRDVILDFDPKLDKIDLRAVDANSKRKGAQRFRWSKTGGFTGAKGQLRWLKAKRLLQGDLDGDRKPDFEIQVRTPKGALPKSAVLLR